MKPTDIYKPHVRWESRSIFGDSRGTADLSVADQPILRAFWEDNDLQELTVVSTKIGMIRTYTKEYKERSE